MLMILIALIISVVVVVALLLYANSSGYTNRQIFAGIAGVILGVLTGLSAFSYSVAAWKWFAAETKAQVINREWGTHYTAKEVYFASDVIDLIRQIDRKRVEVNGDLLREEPN